MKLGAYILRLAASRFFGDMVCYAFDVSAFLSRFFTRCNSFYFDNIPVVTEIVRFSTIPDHDETKKKKEENWSSFQGAAPIERNNSRRAHRFFLLFFFCEPMYTVFERKCGTFFSEPPGAIFPPHLRRAFVKQCRFSRKYALLRCSFHENFRSLLFLQNDRSGCSQLMYTFLR